MSRWVAATRRSRASTSLAEGVDPEDTGPEDTVIVRPNETVTFEFDADNPGQWLAHCHNAYHAGRGMMGVFSYVR